MPLELQATIPDLIVPVLPIVQRGEPSWQCSPIFRGATLGFS